MKAIKLTQTELRIKELNQSLQLLNYDENGNPADTERYFLIINELELLEN